MDILLEMNTLFAGRLGDGEAVSGLVLALVDCIRLTLDYANQYSGGTTLESVGFIRTGIRSGVLIALTMKSTTV